MPYLEISYGTIEGIIPQATLLIKKLSRSAVFWRAEQSIIEAFFQFLRGLRNTPLITKFNRTMYSKRMKWIKIYVGI